MSRLLRYAAGAWVVLTFAALSAAASSSGITNPPAHAIVSPRPSRHASPSPTPAAHATANADLYSRRVRRLVQSYLRMKLLEMREEDLERAREAIERGLGPDTFLSSLRSPRAVPT